MNTFSFYKNIVPLNANEHKNLRIEPAKDGFRFAAQTTAVPLAGPEFAEACRDYPIVFIPAAEGKFLPVAVLGVRENENLFVREDGSWDSTYVPAFVRRYPFIPAQEAGRGSATVCIDEAYSGFNVDHGELLLDRQGNKTPKLEEALNFLETCQTAFAQTQQFDERMQEWDLLTELSAQLRLNSGQTHTVAGFRVVDEEKLLKLEDDKLLALCRSGQMAWVYFHLASLRNLNRLIDRVAARPQPDAEPGKA